MIAGFVTFRLRQQTFAISLDDVREIVRLEGLEELPGTSAPFAGVIDLRGCPLPVLDLRAPGADGSGDVLVLDEDTDPVGVAVDEVLAVLAPHDLPAAAETPAKGLPSYVIGLRRAAGQPVLLIDLQRMLEVAAAGWAEHRANKVGALLGS
jgi:purine-binding chemotaxis protein CheW